MSKLNDVFGSFAERFARLLGSAGFIVVQTCVVILWVALNVVGIALTWDPYPFILLNLAFSTQAAYAAPLILLAQNRHAERDKERELADRQHREEIAQQHGEMLGELIYLVQKHAVLESEDTSQHTG